MDRQRSARITFFELEKKKEKKKRRKKERKKRHQKSYQTRKCRSPRKSEKLQKWNFAESTEPKWPSLRTQVRHDDVAVHPQPTHDEMQRTPPTQTLKERPTELGGGAAHATKLPGNFRVRLGKGRGRGWVSREAARKVGGKLLGKLPSAFPRRRLLVGFGPSRIASGTRLEAPLTLPACEWMDVIKRRE